MHLDWLKSLRRISSRNRRSSRETFDVVVPLERRTLLSALPIGIETKVNTLTTGNQTTPAIAVDADGDYVVTWASFNQDGDGYGIYAQRYNGLGVPQGSEFRVNTFTTSWQSSPAIGMDPDGDFIITWQSISQDLDGYGIYAQRYNALGVPQGSEFRVNSTTEGEQSLPAIGVDAGGNFVIAWESLGQDGDGLGVFAQRFNAAGTAQGTEFRVNSTTVDWQSSAAVGLDADGDFVIAWQSSGQDGNDNGIYAQRYDSAGVPQGGEFLVNSFTTGAQSLPTVGLDADGDFVIAWQSADQDGSDNGIYAQRFNAAGAAQGAEFRVNTFTTGAQSAPTIGIDAAGNFSVAWTSFGQDGSNNGVYARRYNASGIEQGSEFRVNSTTNNNQGRQRIGVDADGDIVFTWRSTGQDGSGDGIYSRRFQVSQSDGVGTWQTGKFFLDADRNRTWSGTPADTLIAFGGTTDKPLVGDWNGDGYDDVGVWRNGTFYLDYNGNGIWDGTLIDKQFVFGNSTDTPLVGDWNGDGKDEIGVWRAGKFYLDLNGNRVWNLGVDQLFTFGASTDKPIVGDWNGDGIDDVGVRRTSFYYLDSNGSRTWNSGVDAVFSFGNSTDATIVGDWNGDGIDDVGVWRAGKFYLDTNGNHAWNSGVDQIVSFGGMTDTPLIGYWRPKNIPGNPPVPSLLPTNLKVSATTSPASSHPLDEALLATLIAPTGRKSPD